MTLGRLCEAFQHEVEELDSDTHAAHLRRLTLKLAKDAAAEIENCTYGEPVALLQLCQQVLVWLKSEAEDTADRQRRYRREQAVLDVLMFCHAVAGFHTGSRAEQRKPANVAALRDLVAGALSGLVEPAA